MSESFYDIAKKLNLADYEVESAIKRAGISCESEFNGNFIWMFDDVKNISRNRIMLHTNSFGEFPIVALPAINMLEHCYSMEEVVNEFGLDTIVREILKIPIKFSKPALSTSELFRVVVFLICIWSDIKHETYRCRCVQWNPLISFDTPIYYRSGVVKEWTSECNIFTANILEIIDSIYKFLLWSFTAYSEKYITEMPAKFPLTLSKSEDILKMPGVACLDTYKCKQVAFNLLTTIRSLIAQMCCMLLRRGNNAFVVKQTTEDTFTDDLKQVYQLIQKMEVFISN